MNSFEPSIEEMRELNMAILSHASDSGMWSDEEVEYLISRNLERKDVLNMQAWESQEGFNFVEVAKQYFEKKLNAKQYSVVATTETIKTTLSTHLDEGAKLVDKFELPTAEIVLVFEK